MQGAKITFILGAGASKAYGYPTSRELKHDVCNELGAHGRLEKELHSNLGYHTFDLTMFRNQFFYSNNASIDAFLSEHEEYMDKGKAAIIFRLIRNEHEGVLGSPEDNWFQYIMEKFIDYDHRVNNFIRGNARFVSFNYDRSLEELIYRYIRNSYYESSLPVEKQKEVASLAKRLSIVHMYGRFDKLEWEQEGAREYGKTDAMFKHYDEISKDIELMRDSEIGEVLEARQKKAISYVKDSDFLVFLGFGFDRQNFNLLKTNQFFQGQNIYASGFGLGKAEQKSIYNMFDAKIREKVVIGKPTENCEEFLKENIVYI